MLSLRNCAMGAALGLALSVGLLPTKGHAYTDEEQQACTPDAMRLCGAFVPDVDRITACMIQNKSQLSPECRQYFRPGPEPSAQAADPPVNIKPAVRKPVAKPVSAKKKPKKPAKPKPTGT